MITLKIKKLDDNAILPTIATPQSAGYDLYSATKKDIVIPPHQSRSISTGISIALPEGTAGLIYARSGLATKHGIIPANCVGVVDSDYRGEVIVSLYNQSDIPYTIHYGDRIAQLVITPILTPDIQEVNTLPDTQRASGGFGSTGR